MRRLYVARILNVLGVLTLAVVGWVTYHQISALILQSREPIHSHEAIQAINAVFTDVQYAETGQRGYLLTGDDAYLEPYAYGTARVEQALDALADTVADDKTQQQDLRRLRAATDAKLAELEETIRLRRNTGLEAALRIVETDRGRRLMDEIGSVVHEMTTREQALLGEQLNDANRKSARALALMEASIGLAGILFVTSGLLVSLDLLRSRRETSKLTTTLESARLNEEMFRLALNHAPIGMALISPEGHWLRVNRALCDMLGYEEEELLGTDFQSLTHPDDLDRDTALVQKLLAKEINSYQTEKRVIRKDGEPIWVLLSSAVVCDAEGQPQYLIRQNQNINQRKLAEQELRVNKERLELVLSGGELGTWDWNVDASYVHYDTRWAEMLGYTVDELAPDFSTWEQLVHPDDKPAVLDVLNRHMRGETNAYEAEHRLRHKDGSWVWVLTKGKVIERDEQNNPLRICGTHLDITETKNARERLAAFARELERSNRELEDFAYIASHDLKEPLRGIRNYANFLHEDYEDKLEDEGRHQLQTLVKLAGRLENFIDALLQYSRVGRTEMSLAPVDLHQQVLEIVDALQGWLDEHHGAVAVRDTLPKCPCHPVLAAEVFRNLITNGIKYNHSKHKVVEVGAEQPNGTGTVFYVRDNGIGIPEKHRTIIFRIFKRLHGRDKYGGGTGAGLSITQKIVERHGGRIWLESEPGAGTTFYFTLGNGADNDDISFRQTDHGG